MNFSSDINSVPLPTADTLMFWGFIIGSGFLVAQLSTKLSERFAQDKENEPENVTEADETAEAVQPSNQQSENNEAVSQTEVVGVDEQNKQP
jgi:hypothetical protein